MNTEETQMGLFQSGGQQQLSDEQAVERYRYMLRTAPPDTVEQAHEEAFAKLSPEQRRLALEQLAQTATPQERRLATDDPKSLARLATRAEIREPGTLERLLGSTRSGMGGAGFGSMLAGSLLAGVAGSFIGSAIANSFFDHHPYPEAGFAPDNDQAGVLEPQEMDTGESQDAFDSDFDGGDFGDFA
jgi:hypothetical protein